MQELKKQFNFPMALSMVIGMVIGAGIFFQAQGTLAVVQSPFISILVWIVAGLITIAAGMTVSELAAALPKTGGIIEYLRVAYNDTVAGVCGWMLTVIYFPSLVGVFAIFFAETFVPFFQLPQTLFGISSTIVVAIALILIMTTINMISVTVGAKIQVVTTIGKLLPIALIIVLGLFYGNVHPDAVGIANLAFTMPENMNWAVLLSAFGVAIGRAFFAYGGWFDVGAIAGEMKNPGKDLPRAIIGGLLIITIVYTLVNVAYLMTFSASDVLNSTTIAADTLGVYFGDFGAMIANIGILVSVLGALNGVLVAGSRTAYQLGKEFKLPFSRSLQRITHHSQAPIGGLIAMTIISILWTSSGQYFFLSDVGNIGSWIFYIIAFFAVIVLRRKQPELVRPYKVPLYPLLPIISILGGLYFLGSIFYFDFTQSNGFLTLIALGIVFAGIPVYYGTQRYYFQKHKSK